MVFLQSLSSSARIGESLVETTNFPVYFLLKLLSSSFFSYGKQYCYSLAYNLKGLYQLYLAVSRRDCQYACILGSGFSINHLTRSDWHLISQSFTVGINNWFIHEFVPDVLSYECVHIPPRNLNRDIQLWRDKALREYIAVDPRRIILLKNPEQMSHSRLADILGMTDNIYCCPYLNIPSSSNNFLDRAFQISSHLSFLFTRIPLFKRCSFIYLVSLLVCLGFKDIILYGIDMNSSKYFWESSSFKSNLTCGLPPSTLQESNEVHSTNDPKYCGVTADSALRSLNRHFLKPLGIRLFNNSPASALVSFLPSTFI
jgi:hypothetical protein